MRWIGIDPGLTGAIGSIDDEKDFPQVWDTPAVVSQSKARVKGKLKVKNKRDYDVAQMARIIAHLCDGNPDSCYCTIEKVWAMPGAEKGEDGKENNKRSSAVGNFSLGKGYGLWLGLLTAYRIPFVEVAPLTWKSCFQLKGKDKSASIAKARQLFPSVAMLRAKDNGRAEALLLASHGRHANGGMLWYASLEGAAQ